MKRITRRNFLLGAGVAGAGLLCGCGGSTVETPDLGTQSITRETMFDNEADPALEATNVTLGIIGDVLVHGSVWQSGVNSDGTRNYDHLFEHVKSDIEAFDIAALDQETILGGLSVGEFSGYPTFNSPQEFADAEVAAGFDVILHANNHCIDKGLAGIKSEFAYWREHYPDVVVTGMADSEEVAAEVPVIERSGHKIAILNYAQDTNGIPLPSDATWCVRMLEDSKVESDFAKAKELGAEAIVVCPHWGEEYAAEPNDYQLSWAQKFVDLGATAIVGNHPHVVQPFDWYENADGARVPVWWSLGNFVSTMLMAQSMIGGLAHFTLTFEAGECSVTAAGLTPLVTHKIYGPGLTTYKLADYTEELASQNAILSDSGNGDFSRQWCIDFCTQRLGDGFDPNTCEFTAL